MSRKIDLTGILFGRLTVDSQYWIDGVKYCDCTCSCGNKKVKVFSGDLTTGATQSCGCLKVERTKASNTVHGLSSTPEYGIWVNIKDRCLNPSVSNYHNYGGRGIQICSGWMILEIFVTDNGPKPSPELSIDRINNNGHYSCGHCEECIQNGWPKNTKWSTKSEQARNRRNWRTIQKESSNVSV